QECRPRGPCVTSCRRIRCGAGHCYGEAVGRMAETDGRARSYCGGGGMTEVEAAVLERARQGDGEAGAELYRRFAPRVGGLGRHLWAPPAAAEAAASEVFARLRRALPSYDPAQPFARWLLAVTSHHCVDLLRRRRLESRLFVADEPEASAEAGLPGATL